MHVPVTLWEMVALCEIHSKTSKHDHRNADSTTSVPFYMAHCEVCQI